MAPRYSVPMPWRQTSFGQTVPDQAPLPRLWLLSDARTDDRLDAAVRALPRGAGVIFRHYHLPPAQRAERFARLRRFARARGLVVVWSGPAHEARRHGAGGCYGSARLVGAGPALLRLVTAHSLRELGAARRARASAVLLSPVFPTRSHPGAKGLGPLRWLLLSARAPAPAIALGGMTSARARRLPGCGWAAIDGLTA